MINKQLLLDKLNNNNPKGIFDIILLEDIILNNYTIKNKKGTYYLGLYNDKQTLSIDSPDYILKFASELLDIEFNSILIGGLGIGTIPYAVQDFCSIVDVVENDQDIIDITNQLNHLNNNVNIIYEDIFTYELNNTYDIIILDCWYNTLNEELTNQLIEKYLPFVNNGGFLYIPINTIGNTNKIKINK
jgi:predicted RNA methylase